MAKCAVDITLIVPNDEHGIPVLNVRQVIVRFRGADSKTRFALDLYTMPATVEQAEKAARILAEVLRR